MLITLTATLVVNCFSKSVEWSNIIPQNLNEARQTVQKRMDYITSELRRQEGLMKDTEKKQEVNREAINKIQHLMQQQQVQRIFFRIDNLT